MARLVAMIGTKKPLLHNVLRTGEEVQDAQALQEMGYSVALFPGVADQAAGAAIDAAFAGEDPVALWHRQKYPAASRTITPCKVA